MKRTRTLYLLLTLLAGACLGLSAYTGHFDPTSSTTALAASLQAAKLAVQAYQMEPEPGDDEGATAEAAQSGTELSVDDGSFEILVGLDSPGTIFFVNRLRPPSYPATLSRVRIFFANGPSNLSPGSPITLLVGSNPDGDENINGIPFQQVNAFIQDINQFNTYSVPNLTIHSGDFVIGFRMQILANVFPGALDTTPPSRRRSYLSTDGFNFALTEDRRRDLEGNVGNWGIRAVVNTQPAGLAALVASYRNNNTGDIGTGDVTIIQDLPGPGLIDGTIVTRGVNSEVVLAPNRRYAVAFPTSNGDSVSVISGLDQFSPFESRVLHMGNTPSAVAITPDSATAIVVNAFSRPVTYRIITSLPNAPQVSSLFSIPNTRRRSNESGAEDVALSPSGDTAIVSLFHDDKVAVIDGVRSGSPTVRAKVSVGKGPNGVAFAPDGNTAFVVGSGDDSVSVISGLLPGRTPFFVRRIWSGVGNNPHAIGLTPDGSKAIVTNRNDNTISIFRVNGNTLSLLRRLSVGSVPAGLSISADGRTALVANANSRTISVIRGLETSNPFVAATLGPSPTLDTATFAERSVALALVPSGGPILDVTPSSLTFNTVVGQGNPPSQQITVRNRGSGSLTFNISSSDSNLAHVSPANGTLFGGQSRTVTVFVTNPNLAGTRTAFLTVNAAGAQNSPQTVSVIVNTTGPPPTLSVIPTSLTFNAIVGQGNPPSQQMLVQNTGGGSLNFTISSNSGFVSVSPTSGTLFSGQSRSIQVTAINPNTPGTIHAQLTVRAPGAQNSPQIVNVTINTQAGSGQDLNEPNDNPQSATFLPMPAPGQSVTINGNALPDDLGTNINQLVSECERSGLVQDWFRLVVNQRDTFQVSLSFQDADADFNLWGFIQSNDFFNFPQGVQLFAFSAQGPGQQEALGARVLEPGTYFIGVSRVRRNTGGDFQRVGYALRLTRGVSPELHAIEDVACAGFLVDDAGANRLFVVNRVRPTRFPARLETISALFFPHPGQPSPNGRPVRIIAFTDPLGSGTPPFNPPLVVDQTVIVNLPPGGRGRFNLLNLGASGPVISQGDFYVGYVVDTPNGIFPDAGRVLYPNIRSFASADGGQTYQPLDIQGTNGQLFNVAIRATVNTTPFRNNAMSAESAGGWRVEEEIEMIRPRMISIDRQ